MSGPPNAGQDVSETGKTDFPLNLAIRIIALHPAAAHMRNPDESFGIHCGTVRHALIFGYFDEGTPILDRSGIDVEIVSPHRLFSGIGKIHNGVVRAPADRVRNLNRSFHPLNGMIRIETVERRNLGGAGILHRPAPEPAAAIDFAIIHPNRIHASITFRIFQLLERAISQIDIGKAHPRTGNQTALSGKADRPDLCLNAPVFQISRCRIPAINHRVPDIDPEQRLLGR